MRKRDRSEALKQVNLLELAPTPCADAEQVGEKLIIHRPTPGREWWRTPLEWFFYLLAPPRVRLDEIGSFVWRELDGRRTVGEIAGKLRERFGDAAEPVEQRLGHLIRVLHREKLVSYPGWDE